jgi:hypothetical protein
MNTSYELDLQCLRPIPRKQRKSLNELKAPMILHSNFLNLLFNAPFSSVELDVVFRNRIRSIEDADHFFQAMAISLLVQKIDFKGDTN